MLTQARLKEVLHYDPKTGVFTRLLATSRRTKIGEIVGTVGKRQGYLACSIDWKFHQMHRLAFLYMTGKFPTYDVDHINGIPSDNRWTNLRDVPTQINMQNELKARINNPANLMGAQWRKDRQCWIACLRVNGKTLRLGSFETAEEAHLAYVEAKRIHHPGFLL